MVLDETPVKIVKEIVPSQSVSLAINFIVGAMLTIYIYPNPYYVLIILIVPPLLSVRGNTSGAFCNRIARDLIIGDFTRKKVYQNIFATTILTLIVALIIGFSSYLIIRFIELSLELDVKTSNIFLLPFLVLIATEIISFPLSIGLNYIVFKLGHSPNNIVPPIMTSVDDILIIGLLIIVLNILGMN